MIGDGAVVYQSLFTEQLGTHLLLAPSALNEPSATSLGMISGEQFLDGQLLDIDDAVPLYVRSSDAELNLKKKQQALAVTQKSKN